MSSRPFSPQKTLVRGIFVTSAQFCFRIADPISLSSDLDTLNIASSFWSGFEFLEKEDEEIEEEIEAAKKNPAEPKEKKRVTTSDANAMQEILAADPSIKTSKFVKVVRERLQLDEKQITGWFYRNKKKF